jgi:DDE_Tnp_1-associated
MASSPTHTHPDQPSAEVTEVEVPDGLLTRLAQVPDRRGRQGRRHSLASILAVTVCALTAAGHDSLTAAAEWAQRVSQQVLATLGVWRDPWTGRYVPPSQTTIRRTLSDLVLGAPLAEHGRVLSRH